MHYHIDTITHGMAFGEHWWGQIDNMLMDFHWQLYQIDPFHEGTAEMSVHYEGMAPSSCPRSLAHSSSGTLVCL